MTAVNVEAFWARIFADANLLERFRVNPLHEARRAGLTEAECAEVLKVNWNDLEMACRSFARKREASRKRHTLGIFTRARAWITTTLRR